MQLRVLVLSLLITTVAIGQDCKKIISFPTDSQVSLSLTMLRTYGERNFPKIFKDDSCYFVFNSGLIDSLALPAELDSLNKRINLFSQLKIDIEINYRDVQSLVGDFVAENLDDIALNTHCCLRNRERCFQVKYSPVFANRLFTAELSRPGMLNSKYFIMFVLDECGDIVFFEVYNSEGALAR